MTKSVVYIGYELQDGRAPHQSMGAIWLAINGHKVTYLTLSRIPPPRWVNDIPTLEYRAFAGNRRAAGVRLARALRKILASDKPDYCYVQGAQQAALSLWVPKAFPRQKLIYHTQDYKPHIAKLYSWAEGVFARQCDLVICNEINRAKVMELVQKLPRTPEVIRTSLPARWHVPERGEMRDRVLAELAPERRATAVLIAVGGSFMPRRKSRELVQSLTHLSEDHVLVFTGMAEGSDRRPECERCAQEAGVADRIIYLDRLEYFELLALYSACEIGVLLYCDTDLANFYQGPGRVTEYLRAGIPFVTSNYPGLELLVMKYDAGEVADPNDPKDIARALKALTPSDEGQRAQTAARLQETANTQLSYEHGARAVLGKLFSEDPGYATHRFWAGITQEDCDTEAPQHALSS